MVRVPFDDVEISIDSDHAKRHHGRNKGQHRKKAKRHARSVPKHPTVFDDSH